MKLNKIDLKYFVYFISGISNDMEETLNFILIFLFFTVLLTSLVC